jgi:hypothetical protein
MSPETIQQRAERLAQRSEFIGCGVYRYERTGRAQLEALIRHGLNPWSKLLDVGSGTLCGAYWMIHFLDPGGYYGIEPNKDAVQAGVETIIEPGLLEAKKPRFDHNESFDFSVFGERFDFFHAHSIWTHASKKQIQAMLDGFVKHSADRAVFLTSYKDPVPFIRPDYRGDAWVGASHEGFESGIVRHSFSWIRSECEARGVQAVRLDEKIHKQRWLRIQKGGAGD